MGFDRGHAKSGIGIPILSSKNTYRDDGMAYYKRGVGVVPVAEALDGTGLSPIKQYIQRIQETIVSQVSYWTIFDL